MNKQPCNALSKPLSLVLIMSSQRFYGGLVTLCLLLSCRLGIASVEETPGNLLPPVTSGPPPASSTSGYIVPVNPATINQADMPTPAAMALPVNTAPLGTDASTVRKFYTLTASLREIYDDNVNTTRSNPQSSLETELSPSVLVDFPSPEGDFSARYTFDITYYANAGNNSSNTANSSGTNNSYQYSHEFVAQYSHNFSERFSLSLADDFRYFIEPSLYESVGTAYRNGQYAANIFNGGINSQWTPLFGTSTGFSNTIIRYDESDVAQEQNSIEDTGTQAFSFAILPKVSLSFGGIADNISYESADRGYTSYTGFVGAQWQILPSLSVTGRGGLSYNVTVDSQTSTSPYAALSVAWSLGARSSLNFDYAHEVTPSDQVGANGQISDRFSGNFRYDITSSLSSHLQGIFTNANMSDSLSTSSSNTGFTEYQYFLDTGLTYHYNSYLDLNGGITLSGVSSNTEADPNVYSRDEVYLGVRGTY